MPLSPVLTASHITKKFSGVVALRDVSFDLRPGEIHALCGENGAGKSTLIKLLSGLHAHGTYDGELTVDGRPGAFHGIGDAERAGLAVIYQELALIGEMSVAENIFLGAAPTRGGLIDWPRLQREARVLLDRFQLAIDPATPVNRLGVGEKQLVEIVRALSKKSHILILDEPTAALAEHEVQTLLAILRDLRQQGLTCIYISHRLEEVFALADRITVLRDGATIWTKAVSETNKADVIRAMVGREITDLFPERPAGPQTPSQGAVVPLRVTGLSVADPRTGRLRLHDIDFSVAAGEVVGLGGLMGAGRTELLMHLFGAWGERRGGTVQLAGEHIPPLKPHQMLPRGLALVSEDRRRYGLVLPQPINFNLSLSSLRSLTRAGLVDSGREFVKNDQAFRSLRIKAPGLESEVGKLSGGNQQKVVVGKALMTGPQVIFLDEPTRGIDVGAKREIYELINTLSAAGKAVVLVSSELPELIGMSDRILMLHEGRIGGEFARGEATQERLMAAAMGHEAKAEPSGAGSLSRFGDSPKGTSGGESQR
jgi:D-xylose transport system ATP-binding protein